MNEATTSAPAAAASAPSAPAVGDGAATPGEQQFSPLQQAALDKATELRAQFSAAKTQVERDALLEDMGSLTRFAYGKGARPLGFAPLASQKAADNSPVSDELSVGAALEPMAPSELETFKSAGTVRGLNRSVAEGVASFVSEMQMPKVVADIVLERALRHFGAAHDAPALNAKDAFAPLDPQDHAEFVAEASRVMGSTEAFYKLSNDVREALGPETMKELDKRGVTSCSLAFDPRVLQTLLYHARTRSA